MRPYVLVGAGLMKTRFELRASSLLAMNDTALGYAAGGGIFVFLGDHFGVRGAVRFFHSFPDVTIVGVTLPSEKLNYSRVGAAIVLQFEGRGPKRSQRRQQGVSHRLGSGAIRLVTAALRARCHRRWRRRAAADPKSATWPEGF